MVENQNQNGYWGDVGRGAAVEGISTLAEQGLMTLGGAAAAYGVSKIGGHFSPTLGTRSGVISRGLVGGFKAGHGSVKKIVANYGMNVGLAAFVGGTGLHMVNSNSPHNKINSNDAINDHPALMSAAGGAIAGFAFAGAPMAAGMKIAGGELGEIIGSKSIGNYLSKRDDEIQNDTKLNSTQRQAATDQIERYQSMNEKMSGFNKHIETLDDRIKELSGQSKKNVKAQRDRLRAERSDAALDMAKEARSGIFGHNKHLDSFFNKTDSAMSKLYHMKGRSAAIMGGSMLLGAAVGAGMNASGSRGGE